MNDSNNSLSHCKWNCKYHIVFAPKYRRQVIYGKIKTDIGQILRKLCTWKGVEIVEAELSPDHVHMLVKIPPKYSVSQFMGYLKGKSTLMIFDKHANLKYKYGRRQFWCDGYYVDTSTYFYGQFLSLRLYNVVSANSTQIYSIREHPNIFANVRLGLFFFTKLP